MTVAFFAMIGMAVPKDKVEGVREAIKKMAEKEFGNPYIITFGRTPDEVYTALRDTLSFTDGPQDGEMWQ